MSASRASDAKGVIHLNISRYAWENARRAFHKEIKNSVEDFDSPSQCPVEPSANDAFAGHLLVVHRLQCRECNLNNGGDALILPDSDKRARALCVETATQTESEAEAEPTPEELRVDSELKVPYYKYNTVDAETQTEQEDESSTATDTSVAPGAVPAPLPDPLPDPVSAPLHDPVSAPLPDPVSAPLPDPVSAPLPDPVSAPLPDPVSAPLPAPLPDPVSESGSFSASNPDPTEPEASTPSAGSPLTLSQKFNYRRIPRGPDGKFRKMSRWRQYEKINEARRKRKAEQAMNNSPKAKTEKRSVPKESTPIEPRNNSPKAKTEKRSVPKESTPIEPRKSQRIQQRKEAQAQSLHGLVFPMPVPTTRVDEDDGWIEDDPSAESLKESKPGKCMSYRSTSSHIKEEDADSRPVTNFLSTSNFEPIKSGDADNRLFTYSEGASNFNPNSSRGTEHPPVPSSSRTSDLEASIIRDAGGSLATHFNSSSWSRHLSPITIPEFSGPPPGPMSKLSPYHQDITFFHLLFPPHLIHHLVVESNYYAERCRAAGGNLEQWTQTTVDEMQAFLGLQMLMSTSCLPDLSLYWSRKCSFLRINVWEVMSQDRFMALLQYFQQCDCSSNSEKGGGSHVRDSKGCKILDIINDCCRLQYAPHRDCTVYEAIIKLANEQEICLCLRVDSENGYCNEFQVCHAEKGARDKPGLRDSIVLDLTHRLQKQHYIVNLSESFTNLELVRTLEGKGILARGAVNNSPRNLVSLPGQLFSKSIQRTMVLQQGNISACSWYNTVSRRRVISSADDPKCTSLVQQKYKGKLIISHCPKAVVCHMKSMHANPFRSLCPTQGRSYARESCIFWFAFDVAVANALVLKHGSGCTQKTMMSFRKALAVQLIKNYRQPEETHRPNLTSGSGVQSHPQHSVCTNDSVQPVRLAYGLDMPSHAMHSSSTDVDIQISRVTGGLGMHSDSTNDMVLLPGPTYSPDMESNVLHSYLTNDNFQPAMSTDGLGIPSQTLHSHSTDVNIQISRVTSGLGVQSSSLHSDGTNDDVKPARLNDGIDLHSHLLHSDFPNDNVQPAVPTDGIGMHSDFGGSPLQPTNLATSYEHIAEKIKVEPYD